MICPECGRTTEKSYGGMCQSCWRYFHDGGKVYPIPEPGTIARDEHGKVICHICGRSYRRLGSHARESHSMTIAEYKQRFGLCSGAKTTEQNYSQTMHEYAIENDMHKRILEIGKKTRIKKGQTDKRKGKKVRLQERLNKRGKIIKKKTVNSGETEGK